MKIKLVDAIRMKIAGRTGGPMRLTNINYSVLSADEPQYGPEYHVHKASVEVFFEQIAPVEAGDMVREKAIRAICRHIYQDVEAELHLALESLWEEGLHDTKAAEIISGVIHAMRGEQNRDRT